MSNFFGGMAGGMARAAGGMQPGLQNPNRPFGVTLIAGVTGFIGGLYLVIMILYLGLINLMASLFSTPSTPGSFSLLPSVNVDTPATVLFIIYLTFLAVAYLAVARGLFLLQQWAYWTLLGLEALNFLVALVILIGNHNGTVFFTNIWIPVLISAYLLAMGGVRRAFRVPF